MGTGPIGITADDLTGAADAAAALARPLRPVAVSVAALPRCLSHRYAVAANTASRACPPEEAYRLTCRSVESLLRAGAHLIYKKTDSNLRGNIGAELAAVGETTRLPVLFAPAFPARGRTVVNGVALVHGVPVAETEIARDPEAPVTCSDIAEIIRSQWPEAPLVHCHLDQVRKGAEAIRALAPDQGVLLLDATTEEDLDAIALAALGLSPCPALAGSAGLVRAVGRRLLGPPEPLRLAGDRGGPVLAVLASASAALTAQVRRVADLPDVSTVRLPCEGLSREEGPMPEVHEAAEQAIRGLMLGRNVVIHASGPLPNVDRPVELVVEHLAHLAFVAVREAQPRALLVGGGSTAQGVLEALAVEAIEVDDGPETGMAAGVLVGGHLAGRPVALKPGAAGGEDVIVSLLEYLQRRVAGAALGGRAPA